MASKNRYSNHHDLYQDVEKIKAALIDTANDVKGKANEMFADSMEGVKENTGRIKDSITDYTEKKPLKSLGIALLVGIAFGYLFRK